MREVKYEDLRSEERSGLEVQKWWLSVKHPALRSGVMMELGLPHGGGGDRVTTMSLCLWLSLGKGECVVFILSNANFRGGMSHTSV